MLNFLYIYFMPVDALQYYCTRYIKIYYLDI